MSRWLTQSELTQLWGKSRQTAAEWARRPGCPKRVRAGKTAYQWPEFLEWWASERERVAREDATPVDAEQAKARKALADAKLAEYELAQAEGRLVTVDDYRKALADVLDAIRAGMLSVPSKWAPMLVGKRSISEVQGVLERLVGQALGDWSVDAS